MESAVTPGEASFPPAVIPDPEEPELAVEFDFELQAVVSAAMRARTAMVVTTRRAGPGVRTAVGDIESGALHYGEEVRLVGQAARPQVKH